MPSRYILKTNLGGRSRHIRYENCSFSLLHDYLLSFSGLIQEKNREMARGSMPSHIRRGNRGDEESDEHGALR